MMTSSATEDTQLSDQNILNYCTSGDLLSLQRCSLALALVVHNIFPDGQTCLIAACRNGHREVAEYLIDTFGADVEQVGVVEFESEQVEGVPPLWCAAAAGYLPVVESLVARGADVNHTTITNSTALRAACFDGHKHVVRYLVHHGANVEIPNRHGHTCLMISCYRRHDHIVEFLLSKHARVNRRSAKGNTALHDCAESGNLKGLQLLLEHGAIMRLDEYGLSPIMSGANGAFKKLVDYLASFSETPSPSSPETATVSIHDKIAAYELLGASLFDRHSFVQDAITAWFEALRLRQLAGTYPKKYVPPRVVCSCAHSDQPVPSDSGQLTDSERRPVTGTYGTNWSLVSLAARETVYLSETTHSFDRRTEAFGSCSRSGSTDPMTCVSSSISPSRTAGQSPHTIYDAKQNRLLFELYESCKKEFNRAGLTTKHSTIPTTVRLSFCGRGVGRSSAPLSVARNNVEFSSPTVKFHPVVGLVHPASPADPIRFAEPMCWEFPRYRRWTLDGSRSSKMVHPSHLSAASNGVHHANTRLKQCSSCGNKVIQFGGRNAHTNATQQCTQCLLDSKDGCLHTSSHTDQPSDAGFVKTSANPCQPNHTSQAAPSICPCRRLAPEDHPLVERLRQFGEEAFGHVREFTNEEELTESMRNAHALRLQPLLIRLRILGPDHLDTIYFIRYRGAIYADTDNFRQCLTLWRYALELQRVFLEPLCHVSQAAFASFAELFQFVLNNNYTGLSAVDLDPALIVDCLELAVDSVERGMDYSFYHWYRRYPWSYSTADKEAVNLMRHVALCLHFIAMILTHYFPEPDALAPVQSDVHYDVPTTSHTDLGENQAVLPVVQSVANANIEIIRRMHSAMSSKLKRRFLHQVYRLVSLDPRVHDGHSLIHLACSLETSTVGRFVICRFPDLAVLGLLFQLGADPNCVDVHGQRPLVCVLSQRRLQVSEQAALVTALVQNGAHLDAANSDGLTALDSRFRHILAQSSIRLQDHMTLQCHAARVARRFGLTQHNSGHVLPDTLWAFIQMH